MRVVRVGNELEKIATSLWVKDYKSNKCNVCQVNIIGGWFFSNKHHCRYCGHIVCALCSNHAIFFKTNYHRICDICYKNAILIVKTKNISKFKTKTTSLTKPTIRGNERKLAIDYQTNTYPTHDTQSYHINRRDILVKGFLRLRLDISLPSHMINLIISWAFTNDIWQQYATTKQHILISQCSQSAERISDTNQHCYYSFGRHIVANNHCKQWLIRIDKIDYYTSNYCSMMIGIAEHNKINWIKSLLGDFTYGVYRGYGLRIAVKSRFEHKHFSQNLLLEKGSLSKGDIIKIRLDLSGHEQGEYGALYYVFEDKYGKEIKYGLDDKYVWNEGGIAFQKIDRTKKYVLVLGMYCKNKVTFLEQCNA